VPLIITSFYLSTRVLPYAIVSYVQTRTIGIIVILAAGALAGAAYFFINQGAPVSGPISPTASFTPEGEFVSTSTTSGAASPTAPQKPARDFAAYPEHTLPEGAVAIDDYFYIYGGALYLNSVQNNSSVELPNIGAESFKRLTDFRSLPDPSIDLACGKAGQYAYYNDSKQVFFYQIWLNSKFKHSKLETLIGVSPEDFSITSPSSFEGAPGTYTINYNVSTSTCNYVITLEEEN